MQKQINIAFEQISFIKKLKVTDLVVHGSLCNFLLNKNKINRIPKDIDFFPDKNLSNYESINLLKEKGNWIIFDDIFAKGVLENNEIEILFPKIIPKKYIKQKYGIKHVSFSWYLCSKLSQLIKFINQEKIELDKKIKVLNDLSFLIENNKIKVCALLMSKRINKIFKEVILTNSFIWYFFQDSYENHLFQNQFLIEKITNMIEKNNNKLNIKLKNMKIICNLVKTIIADKELLNINEAVLTTLKNKEDIIENYYFIEKEMFFQNKSLFLNFSNKRNKDKFEHFIKINYEKKCFKNVSFLLQNYENKVDIRKWLIYKIYCNFLKLQKEKND
ncbi:MAG4530 family protein [Mycoplasmopsis gallinacea]|uniref:Uncharacterized protein n=1 Tax=Mycoplasmopsis gallinacea TaxID=29556 RepID=A0A6H0V2R2_9BACT|nr:hypothetical protein [Mycoplasmopsis gallinacea]QIW61979.1 hypothetical protein GOQ20_00630 [Mycoplasmopsis gallinacea]